MRDPKRIDAFLAKLGEYWKKVPDWRFGQLVENTMEYSDTRWFERLFFIEDDDFLWTLNEFFEKGDE